MECPLDVKLVKAEGILKNSGCPAVLKEHAQRLSHTRKRKSAPQQILFLKQSLPGFPCQARSRAI